MKKLFFTAALIVSTSLFACEVHLPQHFVVIGDTVDLMSAATHTGCPEHILKDVNETLRSVDGKITSFQLAGLLKTKNHEVLFQPNLVNVQHFKSLVREQLMLPAGVQLHSSQALNSPDFITLNDGESVEVECANCLFGMRQPINVKITGIDGTNKSMTVTADFKKMVKAYRVTSFHPAFAEISTAALKEEYVEVIPQTELVTELETLKFFKLNKPVRAGDILRKSDLNALSLVKAGVKTEVIIENAMVKLKTSGISRSNGALGEFVEVFHPQKNKKYLGKVIDINKVLVEL